MLGYALARHPIIRCSSLGGVPSAPLGFLCLFFYYSVLCVTCSFEYVTNGINYNKKAFVRDLYSEQAPL